MPQANRVRAFVLGLATCAVVGAAVAMSQSPQPQAGRFQLIMGQALGERFVIDTATAAVWRSHNEEGWKSLGTPGTDDAAKSP